jgi:hypothetical protein
MYTLDHEQASKELKLKRKAEKQNRGCNMAGVLNSSKDTRTSKV